MLKTVVLLCVLVVNAFPHSAAAPASSTEPVVSAAAGQVRRALRRMLRTAPRRQRATTSRRSSGRYSGGRGGSVSSGNGNYIIGPRGGCYYINSNGKKVYVSHSFCR